MLVAGVSGDLAYIAGIEHATAAVRDGPARAYELRVTIVFVTKTATGEWSIGTLIQCRTVSRHMRSWAA